MDKLLAFSRGVDWMNAKFGRVADFCVLFACAISAGNAILRYSVNSSSNAWLEAQWYLFAGIVMLGASYTLFRNAHVRVDLVYALLPERGRVWVDIFGLVVFLLPATTLLLWMTWPFALDAWTRWEGSPNAGGLLRWPVKMLLPLGFGLLTLQGLSELIKRIALLRGPVAAVEVVTRYQRPEQ